MDTEQACAMKAIINIQNMVRDYIPKRDSNKQKEEDVDDDAPWQEESKKNSSLAKELSR